MDGEKSVESLPLCVRVFIVFLFVRMCVYERGGAVPILFSGQSNKINALKLSSCASKGFVCIHKRRGGGSAFIGRNWNKMCTQIRSLNILARSSALDVSLAEVTLLLATTSIVSGSDSVSSAVCICISLSLSLSLSVAITILFGWFLGHTW